MNIKDFEARSIEGQLHLHVGKCMISTGGDHFGTHHVPGVRTWRVTGSGPDLKIVEREMNEHDFQAGTCLGALNLECLNPGLTQLLADNQNAQGTSNGLYTQRLKQELLNMSAKDRATLLAQVAREEGRT